MEPVHQLVSVCSAELALILDSVFESVIESILEIDSMSTAGFTLNQSEI
jgi:hypothetical protein